MDAMSQVLRSLRLRGSFYAVWELAPPWGLNVGDLLGHFPLPAKITTQILEPVDLSERYGEEPDVQRVYDDVTATMQSTLDDLAAERRLPLIG